MDNVPLQQVNNCIPLLKYRYLGYFPSDNVSTLDKDTFAIVNTKPSEMQGEPWIFIAKLRQEILFADSLGRKKFRSLKQQYKQVMPAELQSHLSVCGFYTVYAAFHLSKFCQ